MKKYFLIAVLFFAALTCAENKPATKQEVAISSEPYEFVKRLYANYQIEGRIFNFKGKGSDTIFSYELLQLIKLDEALADGEVGYLGGDPICSCQDAEGLTVEDIKIEEISCNTFAHVILKISNQKIDVVLKLTKQNGKWLIADIKSAIAPSLYKYLFENLIADFIANQNKNK